MDRLDKYLAGYTAPAHAESAGPKRGDPQRSALVQYLVDKFLSIGTAEQVDPNDCVVDFGSGEGVIADELERVVPAGATVPLYIAVDLPEPLRRLALPARIHNRSQKWTVQEFYSEFLPKNGHRVRIIFLRNVLHEMNIVESAALFCHLNRFVRGPAELYIQDIATLPQHERGKAGWTPKALTDFMTATGMKPAVATQQSFQGTEWFIVTTQLPGNVTDLQRIQDHCAVSRRSQYKSMLKEANSLNELTDGDSVTRLIQLQGECTSLSIQLLQSEDRADHRRSESHVFTSLARLGIHISYEAMGDTDFAIEVTDDFRGRTGLLAILSSKSILDFPTLYRSCRTQLLFSGYSQRLLFASEANREALRLILGKQKRVRILLVDPTSAAAVLRADSPAYANPDELVGQITSTLDAARLFDESLNAATQTSPGKDRCKLEVKLGRRPPSCSYFFVDDLCFMSLYSDRMTGSRGFCFVFSNASGAYANYYHFLLEDFTTEWNRSSGAVNA